MSGRVESSWPNLTNVGPSSSRSSRRCCPRALDDASCLEGDRRSRPRQQVGELVGLEEVAEPVADRDLGDLRDAAEAPLGGLRHSLSVARRGRETCSARLRRRRRRHRARRLDQAQAVLQLGDPKLELLELLARDEAELPQHAGDALARPFADPAGVAAPARHRVLEQLPSLVAADAALLAQIAGELVQPLGRERDRTDGGQREPTRETSAGSAMGTRPPALAASLALRLRLRDRPVAAGGAARGGLDLGRGAASPGPACLRLRARPGRAQAGRRHRPRSRRSRSGAGTPARAPSRSSGAARR